MQKITYHEFERLIMDPDVPDEDIAKYLTGERGSGRAFKPKIVIDQKKVEIDDLRSLETALDFINSISRWRRKRRFESRVRSHRGPIIVTEGDSWFQFPFLLKDVVDHLNEGEFLCWSVGAGGDTAQNMVFDDPEYLQALDECQRLAGRVDAFLLSAAGNDIIGDTPAGEPALEGLLKTFTNGASAQDLIDFEAVDRTITRLETAYSEVVTKIRAKAGFSRLPILFHGYDVPFPGREDDERDPVWAGPDKWLGSVFRHKGIADEELQRKILTLLIDRLYVMLDKVAGRAEGVYVVDLRKTTKARDDWADEIHPTSIAFGHIAEEFATVARDALKNGSGPPHWRGRTKAERVDDVGIGEDVPLIRPKGPIGPPQGARIAKPDRFAKGFGRAREARFERRIGRDDSLPFFFLKKGTSSGRAVCKIVAEGRDFRGRNGRWHGTGVLVGPGVILTNHHVVNSVAVARRGIAIFDHEEDERGQPSPTRRFHLDPDDLFISSPADRGLDYAFVAVAGEPEGHYPPIEMHRGAFVVEPEDFANIVHHPFGRPKRASLHANRIVGLDGQVVHYTSDTEEGSSGAPVFDNAWRVFALHHAWREIEVPVNDREARAAGYVNEGIKMSAIAADLESRLSEPADAKAASRCLRHFKGTDSITGYFGSLGRSAGPGSPLERTVAAYDAKEQDVDVAFWNVEWFNRDYSDRVDKVAEIIADLNLDIWGLSEISPDALKVLVERLQSQFGQDFGFEPSEPDAPSGRQTTGVIWNKKTVACKRLEWPDHVHQKLKADSRDVDGDTFEAVDGKIFNRYPGLFQFKAVKKTAEGHVFDFNLVPLHLKAKAEGAGRRRLAAQALRWAIAETLKSQQVERDWIIGGDVNAELQTGQFDALTAAGYRALSARDEEEGGFTYLGRRYRSLIDTIFLSPSLAKTYGEDDFFIYAADKNSPDFAKKVSDHRPVLVRLSLADAPSDEPPASDYLTDRPAAESGAADAEEWTDKTARLLEEIAAFLKKE